MTDHIDTAAIRTRSQQPGYQEGQALIDVIALCDENEKLRRMLDLRGVGPAERYWEERWRDEAAENDRLRIKVKRMAAHITEASNQARYRRTEIKGHQRRIVRLQAENDRLRAALTKINVGDGWAAQIARAALAQKGEAE